MWNRFLLIVCRLVERSLRQEEAVGYKEEGF